MSSQQLQFYEQKIISDKEFPIEVFMNQVQDKCQYFHTHWHEHIELHYVVHGETDILLNQTRYTFRQGDLAVINSNVMHAGFCSGAIPILSRNRWLNLSSLTWISSASCAFDMLSV